jgi:mRNA-degrading endonuclease toxin of MazEF toxin-antitoxin module
MKRGDVFWADLVPRSGSEQSGRRPVVVVSHAALTERERWRSIIVVPLSTSIAQSVRASTVVRLPRGTAGLPRECAALCHQVTTLDRAKFRTQIGALPRELLAAISTGLRVAMDLD